MGVVVDHFTLYKARLQHYQGTFDISDQFSFEVLNHRNYETFQNNISAANRNNIKEIQLKKKWRKKKEPGRTTINLHPLSRNSGQKLPDKGQFSSSTTWVVRGGPKKRNSHLMKHERHWNDFEALCVSQSPNHYHRSFAQKSTQPCIQYLSVSYSTLRSRNEESASRQAITNSIKPRKISLVL